MKPITPRTTAWSFTRPEILSIGDQVQSGAYRFHSRFNHVVNFERDGRLLSLVDEHIGPGPLNIVLGGRLESLFTPLQRSVNERLCEPLRVRPRMVTFAGHCFPFTRAHRYNSRLELKPGHLESLHRNLHLLGELLKKHSPPQSLAFLLDPGRLSHFRTAFARAFATQITRAVRQVFGGHLLEGIRALKGCGLGLTPSGDDFIAGLLIALNVPGRLHGEPPSASRLHWDHEPHQSLADTIFKAAHSDNLFSNTFLDLARSGLLDGRVKDLLLMLAAGSRPAVQTAAKNLLARGHTSGADLATGFFLTASTLQRLRQWKFRTQGQPQSDR